MDNIQAKVETWIKLIQLEKLQDVLEDIQMSIRVRPNNQLNKKIFKLLLHLCRTVDKCNKQNYEIGKKLAELTKLLCSLLVEIPDDNNFVKCLFIIVRYLISLNLYDDAAEICCYLQSSNLFNPKNDTMELLTKVLSLWHASISKIYIIFANELNIETYNHLKNVIKHEMKITQFIYKNYTKYLIIGISKHLDKIATIGKEANKYFDDFYKYILEYLTEIQLHLDKDHKYVIYCHILRIMCHIIYRTINMTDIGYIPRVLDELSSYFKTFLMEDKELYQCFQQFQSLCATLLVPMENYVSDHAKKIQNIICCSLNIAQKYGYTGGLKLNAIGIPKIVEPMFIYWEKCIETNKHMLEQLLNTGILLEMMNLIVHMNTDEFYIKQQVLIKCKWCLAEECTVKIDLYNTVVMKCQCISIVCKFFTKTLPEEIYALTRKILEQNATSIIHEVRECKCKRWINLWNTCRALMYNVGIQCEHVYEESVRLLSLLCTCIFQLQEIESNSENLANSVSLALHKLSVLHYNNSMYRKAMTVSALNALLTYNQSNTKAFRMWANIKKCAPENIAKLTILECLINDKDEIKKEMDFSIDISKYDLIKLCSREIRSLLEEKVAFTNGVSTVLEKFRKLKPTNYQYVHVIQLLGHYLLDFQHNNSVLKYYEQAIFDLKQDKMNSIAIMCLEANLNFFMFIEELHTMIKQTHMEMENTKFALYAPKLPELSETKSPNIVPAYTMINVKKDSSLILSLQRCLKKWKQLFKYNINELSQELWEPNLILRMLITSGEYSRLYRYEDCEANAWMLAYKLASKIDDYFTIIYVTGRCISLRQINYHWIATAKEHAMKHRHSKDENVIRVISIFWMSLADFYFECGKCDDAKQLLTEARSLPGISFHAKKSVYLLSLDILIRNNNLYIDNMQHEDYGSYIVESLFAMRSLNQDLLTKKSKCQAECLFSYDVLFTTMVNLSMRVNSLLSFRGISADLVRCLKTAQSIGAVIRVAELLRSLCYIDLSRSQLDHCEVKLQGLEYMLDIESFQLSMNSKPVQMSSTHLSVTPTKIVDPIRDVPQNDTSPVLGKKVFDLPKFTLHVNCNCYKCVNVSYQYLVFATTYIRAQLYALQNHDRIALDHFHGAFKIRQKLFQEESILFGNWLHDEADVKRFCWQARFYITDYVQLLIDFCYFLKTKLMSRQQNAVDIINLAINICYKYKLEGHPVYMSAKELALDNSFQPILEFSNCLKYMVTHDIDISSYTEVPTNPNVCVTPSTHNSHAKKLPSIRRRRSPMALKITKVHMIWDDDEDDNSSSPSSVTYSSKKSRAMLVRRKILEEDPLDDIRSNTENSVPEKTKLTYGRTIVPEERKSRNCRAKDGNSTQRKSIQDIMIKVAPLVPDISQNLIDLVEELDVPVTAENIEKLIQRMESLKVNSDTTIRKKRNKDMKQLTDVDYNKNVNRAIEILKNMTINEKTNKNIDPLELTITEKINKLQVSDEKISEVYDEKKSIKTSGILKQSTENVNISSKNELKTTRIKYQKLLVNNEDQNKRMTRSSLRKCKEKPL